MTRRNVWLLALLPLVWTIARGAPPAGRVEPGYTYRCEIKPDAAYDGDTLTQVDIDLGFRIRTQQRVRLLGLDCPEMAPRDPDRKRSAASIADEKRRALAARDFLREWLRTHTNLVLETRIDRKATDPFDRYLARIYGDRPDGVQECVNQQLLDAGHAKPFMVDQ